MCLLKPYDPLGHIGMKEFGTGFSYLSQVYERSAHTVFFRLLREGSVLYFLNDKIVLTLSISKYLESKSSGSHSF
jgi:hypothetical protein